MKTSTIGAATLHRPPVEFPTRAQTSLAAMHDFLVPNLRPDLAAEPDPAPPARAQRRYIEPDSMFWNPESHAGDAA